MAPQASILLWKEIYEITEKVCKHYNMKFGSIAPETRMLTRCYGETFPCDKCANNPNIKSSKCKEKILTIRVHQLKNKNKPLANSTIIRTLAHELAHLREWKHGPAHKEFELQILKFIKDMGYTI